MLAADLRRWRRDGWRVLILADRTSALSGWPTHLWTWSFRQCTPRIDREIEPGEIIVLSAGVRQGYEDPDEKFAL